MAGGKRKAGAYNPLTIRLAVQLANPRSWVASVCPALFGICYCWVRGWPLGAGRAAALLAAETAMGKVTPQVFAEAGFVGMVVQQGAAVIFIVGIRISIR